MALHLPILDRCDLACVFCSAAGRCHPRPLKELLSAVDEDRTGHVQVSGGEPLLYPAADLLRLLKHCRKAAKIVELQTNALAAGEFPEDLLRGIAVLVTFFNVNLSAHDAETDARVSGVSGVFARRLSGIRRLLALGARVRLTHVLCRQNHAAVPEFVRFAAREIRGFEWIQFSFVKGIGRAAGASAVLPKYEEVAEGLRQAMGECRRLGIPFDVDHVPPCYLGEYKQHHVDFQKFERGEPGPHLEEKERVEACRECPDAGRCAGPRKDYIEVHKRL